MRFFDYKINIMHFLLSIFLSIINIISIFFYAPKNLLQGLFGNIFYIHVPVAWTAFLGYLLVAIFSATYLIKKEKKWDIYALASAELSSIFMLLVLITGPIWAKPAWGHFWVWEPRLTTSLILFLVFVGYFMLREFGGESNQTARFASVLGLIAFVNVPIIFYSVKLWLPELQSHPQVGQYFEDVGLKPTLVLNYSLFSLITIFTFILRLRSSNLKVSYNIK